MISIWAAVQLVSFAAVIQVVTQCSSPTNGCSLKLCIPFPLLLRTNNMHVTVSSYTNHISRYICRQRSRFPRNGSLLLIGQFKERNAALEWAAVSWGGALRDDPNNGCEGEYSSVVLKRKNSFGKINVKLLKWSCGLERDVYACTARGTLLEYCPWGLSSLMFPEFWDSC